MSIHTKETRNGTRNVVRYRSPDGRSREKRFTRKGDAKRFETEIRDAIYRGQYVDPRAGRLTFRTYADQWRHDAMHKHTTAQTVENRLRRHVHPALGDRPIGAIRPHEIQRLIKHLSTTLAPSTVETTYRHIVSIFKHAVANKVIAATPCVGIVLPKAAKAKIVPISTETFWAIAETISPRFRALVEVAAATGLRQGELFGLTIDRIDFLHRTITVDRQIQLLAGVPSFTTPKTSASRRVIPVPQSVLDAINAHIDRYGLGPDGLIFTGRTGNVSDH
jgi:integrase